ncbi:MAG: elongation factor P-like protein YeiP [Lentisphaerae bacterium RIFOXYC12_FULL_60_16]|nr:MAG: elongation factor P-like protein YeiP [Lentisphaerae bacterium RIFOXYC12_FULL_60_16]OGV70245.1 MAG: elongation factor P-like protein YeiP [Lentisphaerae bacterium RIFOXYA12_FULL_60_10]OGV86492.1 MAG: elongation factor P-like protein YeiP [Lentisphaerae bacterium RIFOXYB12_FULL_60_10]
MVKAPELKRGVIVDLDGKPHIVEQMQVQSPSARGAATLYKVRFRNLSNRQKADRVFRADDVMRGVEFERHPIQFLFRETDRYTFMDLESYDQFTLDTNALEDALPYLVDGMEGIVSLIADGSVLGIELPPVVEMEVMECDPYMKGASATGRTKSAKLVTGLVVQVPEYLTAHEMIRVDTRTGMFVSRA